MTKQANSYDLRKYLGLMDLPMGPLSQTFLVDPVNGSDNNPGTNLDQPFASLEEAEDHCVADQHDAVVQLSGDMGNALSAALAWDKAYTHLVGLGSRLPGVGQRTRITGSPSVDATQLLTISANGCIFRDFQLFNGADADADSGAAIVSGSRNEFTRIFFAGMGHATPAARAGSYSLKLQGAENFFDDCVIGLDTIVRAAANAELVVDSANAARNHFRRCRFQSYSETAGKFLAQISNMDRWIEFESCKFHNFSVNWAASLTNAFNVSASATHLILFTGEQPLFVGCTGIGDIVTHMYASAPAPNAGWGLGLNPTT